MPDENPPSQIQNPNPSPVPTAVEPVRQSPSSEDLLDQGLREAFRSEGADLPKGDVEDPVSPPKPKEPEVVPPEEKPSEPEKTVVDDEPPVDPATIAPPKNIGAKMMEGWNHLKKNNTRAWNALSRATDENKKLKAALAERATMSGKELEDLKKQNAELQGIRAIVDYQHDPEFINTYEAPASNVKEQMVGMLKHLNVRDDVVNSIDFTDPGTITRVAKVIEERVDSITANRFLKRGEELVDLNEKREKAISEHRVKHKEFWENRRKQAVNSSMEEEARMIKRMEDVSALKDEKGHPQYPFIATLEVPPTASKSEIAQIEAHNKMAGAMREKLNKVIKMKTPEERAEIAVAAVAASYINTKLNEAKARIKSLEETLKKYNDVSSERGGTSPAPAPKTGGSIELEDALNNAFPQFKPRI